ncbi:MULTISPECIES: dynamin family protein [Acinetobacter]|uniref:dynamin family protein n=1 Tax=Acinetobacter TaxID=469 RepID=UPI000CFF0C60|nr:dynamin family protein [Acinetobacter sp. MYb10]QLD63060.1 dynamin family protein [Acinetobacter sp. MYb10]
MENNQDWLEIYRQRDQWATKAYQNFLDQVDPDLEADLTRSDQITIVVYGSTQVGKTTLILKLLRIKVDCIDEVSKPLRGGREIGKSSTVIPIRYRKSIDDQWHFRDSQNKSIDINTVDEYFEKLREAVERGKLQQREIIDVHIPNKYFYIDVEQKPLDIRILDLPGIQARDENEQRYVEEITRTYATTADLVLLVGRLDDLTFLNPERLALNEFKSWTSQLNRFRIVLTYSFSPVTILDYIKAKKECFDLDSFRQRITEQLCTHDFINSNEYQEIIFPLEFGRSLSNMESKNPDYFNLIEKVNHDSFVALYESLHKAANPYARFMNGFNVQNLVKEKIKNEQNNYEQQCKKLNEELEKYKEDTDCLKNICADYEYKEQKIQYEINNLLDIERESFITDMIKQFSTFSNSQKPDVHTVTALKTWLKKTTLLLRQSWTEVETYSILKSEEFYLGQPPSLDTANLASCYKMLNDYWFDDYWIDATFDKDFNILYHAIEQEIANFAIDADKQIKQYCKQKLIQKKKEFQKIRDEIRSFVFSKDEIEQKVGEIENTLKVLNAKHEKFIINMIDLKRHAESFQYLMKCSFKEACKQSKKDFIDERNIVKKFHRLWYGMILEQQYAKFSEVKD